MKNKIKDTLNNLDKNKINNKKWNYIFCIILCILSISLLITYIFWFSTPLIFNIGIMLFQISLLFSVEFLICGIVVDSLKKINLKLKFYILHFKTEFSKYLAQYSSPHY